MQPGQLILCHMILWIQGEYLTLGIVIEIDVMLSIFVEFSKKVCCFERIKKRRVFEGVIGILIEKINGVIDVK